jgi:hypothetical protein
MVERGPMALFGAIIAVGLGPAMWLGAQFGVEADPTRPPAIVVDGVQAPGGAGAGETPDDAARVLDTNADPDPRPRTVKKPTGERRPDVIPTTTAGPAPSESSAGPTGSPGAEPTAPTEAATTPSTSPSPDTNATEVPASPPTTPPVERPGLRGTVNLV